MTRQQIEAVLRKHSIKLICHCGTPHEKYPSLIDDLLALAPTPSREKLREKLEDIFHRYQLVGSNQSICDEIMAWTTG